MKKPLWPAALAALVAAGVLALLCASALAVSRGVIISLKAGESPDAQTVDTVTLYAASHALVIGIDNYTGGWPRLSNAVADARLVAQELESQGFQVTLRQNLKSTELEKELKEFFILQGNDPEARLFVWFAGHGATLAGEGYLVPADAPLPESDAQFKLNALSMRRFGEYVRQARSKHVFAVFDSCFSGTIFSTQRSKPPTAVTRATTLPVRQFLASGDETQEVSDNGDFRKLFLRALRGEERADLNNDGYLTASELGMFLDDRLTNLTNGQQTPRYGKLRDADYDRGDFIFLAGGAMIKDDSSPVIPQPEKGVGGSLKVTSEPAGATVSVDGSPLGVSPRDIADLPPGKHRVRAEKEGFLPEEREVEVGAGRTVRVAFVLSAEVKRGRLYVRTQPADAQVRVLNIAPSYQPGMELEAGRYQVEVSRVGYRPDSRWLEVSAGEDLDIAITLSKEEEAAVPATAAATPGATWTEPVTGMEFVYVKGGCFQMGDIFGDGESDEKPVHEVCVDDFYIARYEVTQGQWQKIMGYNPSYHKKGDTYPVDQIFLKDIQDFSRKLTQQTGRSFRLPTEAEWEFACRSGGKEEQYCGGNDVDAVAWNFKNHKGHSQPVGTRQANGLGLYDMSGNVDEWVQDWYGEDFYKQSPRLNPQGPSSGSTRVVRGCGWNCSPDEVRSASRYKNDPAGSTSRLGFRLVLPLDKPGRSG